MCCSSVSAQQYECLAVEAQRVIEIVDDAEDLSNAQEIAVYATLTRFTTLHKEGALILSELKDMASAGFEVACARYAIDPRSSLGGRFQQQLQRMLEEATDIDSGK